jgi:hypothetical protein
MAHLTPILLQEEAEALLELQGRLQEAQDTTEALQAQVGLGPRDKEGWDTGRGHLGQDLVSACFLSDRGGVGWGSWEFRRCSCRAFEGPSSSSSRRQSRVADGSYSRCMGSWQVRAGSRGLMGRPGVWAFPLNSLSPPGLRARMASLRQGCGDLRGLVSTFTQSCQGSLSEARGQVRTPPFLALPSKLLLPSQSWEAAVLIGQLLALGPE